MTSYQKAKARIIDNLQKIESIVDSETLEMIKDKLDQIEADAVYLLEGNAFEITEEDLEANARRFGLYLISDEMYHQAMQALTKEGEKKRKETELEYRRRMSFAESCYLDQGITQCF